MKTRQLKTPFALRAGQLVHISEVESGAQSDCHCPACNNLLIARKGDLKVHHFAHTADLNCQPETVLHLLGKRLLAENVNYAIREKTPLIVVWGCNECNVAHEINIMKQVCSVAIEQTFGTMRPDVTLLSAEQKPVAVFEVVVSHPPEDNVISCCKENNVPLFEFALKRVSDLEKLRDSLRLLPSKTQYCPRPKCSACGHGLLQRKVFVVPGNCWRCRALMPIAFVDCEGLSIHPSQMTATEVDIAQANGAYLKLNHSNTMKESYLSNTCPTCGILTGDMYLHDFYHLADNAKGIVTGLTCPHCDF